MERKLTYQRTFNHTNMTEVMAEVLYDNNIHDNNHSEEDAEKAGRFLDNLLKAIGNAMFENMMAMNICAAKFDVSNQRVDGWGMMRQMIIIPDNPKPHSSQLALRYVQDMMTPNTTRVMIYDNADVVIGFMVDYERVQTKYINPILKENEHAWSKFIETAVLLRASVANDMNQQIKFESDNDFDAELFKEKIMNQFKTNKN